MRRPTYQQIIDWKRRRGDVPRLGTELVSQIDQLEETSAALEQVGPVFIEFVPMRLVTILEVYVREAIRELVDEGEPYFGRAEKLTKGATVDLAFAAHVDREELSIGDFVAHAVPLNSLENIVAAIGALVENFPRALAQSHPRWTEEQECWPLPPIIDDVNAMMGSLRELFEVQHILTHELPELSFLVGSNIPRYATACRLFIEACDWVVVALRHGSVPRTQTQRNVRAGNDLQDAEAKLAAKINEVRRLPGINSAMVDDVQGAWLIFAAKAAGLEASVVEGGSMYPMTWASAKAALTADRIDQCDRLIRHWTTD